MSCNCLAKLEKAILEGGWRSYWEQTPFLQTIRAAQREAVYEPKSCWSIQHMDYDHAKAWEKWAREVAVPALEHYDTMMRYYPTKGTGVAEQALASRPKEQS